MRHQCLAVVLVALAISFLSPKTNAAIDVLVDLDIGVPVGNGLVVPVDFGQALALDGSQMEFWFTFADMKHVKLISGDQDLSGFISTAQSLQIQHSSTTAANQPTILDAYFTDPIYVAADSSFLSSDHQSPLGSTFYNAALPDPLPGVPPTGQPQPPYEFFFHDIHFLVTLPEIFDPATNDFEMIESGQLFFRPGSGPNIPGRVMVGVWNMAPEPTTLATWSVLFGICAVRRRR